MYIIGINFGYNETTASCLNTDDCKLSRLHILDGDWDESNKVESAVCRDSAIDEWRFIKDFSDYSSPDFTHHFKAPINEITLKNKEAFAAFVKLVYGHILANNAFLNNTNSCIYIACSSGWNNTDENQIREYKEFLSSQIPIECVIRGNDAVYFKLKAEKEIDYSSTVLVIDYGSSTIDFTAYRANNKSPISIGFKHGASNVEQTICKYFNDNDSNFREAKENAKALCKENNINWLAAVLHYVKGQIEDFYEKDLISLCLDLSNCSIHYTLNGRIFDSVCINKSQLENNILKDYKVTLMNDMNTVKDKLGNTDIVVLTGEASRMSWFQLLVKDVFNDSKVVLRDYMPSYDVSDGLAWYGIHHLSMKRFWMKHTDNYLAEEIWKSFNESFRNILLPKFKAIFVDFNNGELDYDFDNFGSFSNMRKHVNEYNGKKCIAEFLPTLIKSINKILSDEGNEFSSVVNKATNERLKIELAYSFHKEILKSGIDFDPQININPTVNIKIRDLSIDCEQYINNISEMAKALYEELLKSSGILKNCDIRQRRQMFSIMFYNLQRQSNINIPISVLNEAVISLKENIKDGLDIENIQRK